MASNLPAVAGLTWHWSEKWKSLWYWSGSGGKGESAAADFGFGVWRDGRRSGDDGYILRVGSGLRGRRKIQTVMPVPAPQAFPHSHCWPGWHVSGQATALAPAGGPARPAPS